MHRNHWKTGFLMAAAALALAACSGEEQTEESFECGAGTVLQNGECVVAEHDCPHDQVATPLGHCEPPDIFCGDGSTYDVDDEECVSKADVRCGEGTVEDDGFCRVEDPLECGTGTVLADEECVLFDSVCGPGTTLEAPHCEPDEDQVCDGRTEWDVESGECVDLGAVECGEDTVESNDSCIPMSTFADELAADADIDYTDGEPIEVSEDEPFVFTGTMDDELLHVFEFEGTQGQWLDVELYPRGLPSPGLHLRQFAAMWDRIISPGMASQPSRTVWLPSDDDYQLIVSTFIDEVQTPEASGDSSWQYVGTVEVVEPPEAVFWDDLDEPIEGDLTHTKLNLIELDVADTAEVMLTTSHVGADVEDPFVEVWHDTDDYADRSTLELDEQIEIEAGDTSELYLHFDAVELKGPRTDFAADVSATETIPPDGFYTQEIEAQAGDVIFLSHRSMQADPVAVNVWLDQDKQYHLDEVLAENQSSYSSTDTRREFFYVPEDGEYLVEFQNTGDDDIEGFISTSGVEDIPTFEVAHEGVDEFEESVEADDLEPGDWRFALIEAPTPAAFDITITAGSGNPRASVFDTDRNELVDTSGSLGTATMDFDAVEAGAYFVVSRPWSTWSLVSDGLTFEMESEAVDVLAPGEVYEDSFDVDAFDVLHGSVSHQSTDQFDIRLSNPHGQLIVDETIFADEMELLELFPGPGEFTLEIENTGDEPLFGFDADLGVSSPLEILEIDSAFSRDYDGHELDAGESDVLLFQSHIDALIDLMVLFGSDEEAILRVWDVESSEMILEIENDQRVDLEGEGFSQGIYVIELEALTDLDSSPFWSLDGSEIHFVDEGRVHDPPHEIPTDSEGSSALSVDGCAEIVDVSVSMNMPSGAGSSIYIDLYAPDLDDPIRLRDGTFGSLTTTYPDSTEPHESLDELHGTSANGVWSVDIENTSSWTDAELESWEVHLTCVN